MLKKARLVWLKRLQGVWQIARLKQQRFLSFTFYKTQRSYEKIICIDLLFHWFSGENCMIYIYFTQRTTNFDRLKKRNMNDGTIVFLTSLLITLAIVTRNNIVWKLGHGYCLCYCKTLLLVPDSTECIKIFVTEKCSTLFVSPKIE